MFSMMQCTFIYSSRVVSGRRGVFTGVSGLQIAYVSGREALQEPAPAHCFTSKDLSALVEPLTSSSKFRGVDILLTSQWPRGVWRYGNNPVRLQACAEDDCVSWSRAPLVSRLCCRKWTPNRAEAAPSPPSLTN